MALHSPLATCLLAEVNIPLPIQITCIVLTALFLFAFSVAREPRNWRRLFQSMFASSSGFSVNKNKVIDESLKRYGIIVAMVILVIDVSLFVWGLTAQTRQLQKSMTQDEAIQLNEIQKLNGNRGSDGARRAVSN
jgi:uncharacterized membrane protein AbrB (regulator of aidB expression)